jgi:hypothetical protein
VLIPPAFPAPLLFLFDALAGRRQNIGIVPPASVYELAFGCSRFACSEEDLQILAMCQQMSCRKGQCYVQVLSKSKTWIALISDTGGSSLSSHDHLLSAVTVW